MADKIYRRMRLRRRLYKRICVFVVTFILWFYLTYLLLGNYKQPRVMNLTELDKCPACYGVSVCPELYSNQITLETLRGFSFIFNAKNIYYGYSNTNRRVVLKKLAHDWELKDFDASLCKIWGLKDGCKPLHIVNASNIDEKVIKIVQYNFTKPEIEPRKGLTLCPYTYSFYDLVRPVLNDKANYKFDMMYLWTMLMINPEPILLQVIPKSKGWPVPAYGGVCGRLELVGYEGTPLSSLLHIEWHRKLKYAKRILEAAMDFTFKHDRFRFYLMDWSLDNIVANDFYVITFVDLEDVIVLDKHISPRTDLPNWYKRYSKSDMGLGFAFSINNLCQHHLSDHNIWAACYVLAGEETPLLYPIPKYINDSRPHFDRLLKSCLYGYDRFNIVTKLQHVINEMLIDENVAGYEALLR